MKVNGKMTANLAMALNYTQIPVDMKANLLMENKKAWVPIFGLMEKFMTANGLVV